MEAESTSWQRLGVLGLWTVVVTIVLGGCSLVASYAFGQFVEHVGSDQERFDAQLTIAHESDDGSIPPISVQVTRVSTEFDFGDIEVGAEQLNLVEIVPHNGWQSSYGGALQLRVEPLPIGFVSEEPVCTGAEVGQEGVEDYRSTRLGYDRETTNADDNINIRCVITSRSVAPGAVHIRAVTDSGDALPETVTVTVRRERHSVEPGATIEVPANPGLVYVAPRGGELWVPRDQACEFRSQRLLLAEGETTECTLVYERRPES